MIWFAIVLDPLSIRCVGLSDFFYLFFFYFFLVVTRGTLVRVETPGSKHTSLQARSEHPRWILITFLLTTGGETRAEHFCFPFEGTHDREISGEG